MSAHQEASGHDGARAQLTKTRFECELVTISSQHSFAALVNRIERTFQRYDVAKLERLTNAGNREELARYVREIGAPTEFGLFYAQNLGPAQRLAGIPIESKLYLFGNATIAQGLFRCSARAGLGAPVRFCVSQQDGQAASIDIDLPSAFFSQFPEMRASPAPQLLDERMIPLLQQIAN